jgi:hypothetical protein
MCYKPRNNHIATGARQFFCDTNKAVIIQVHKKFMEGFV